MSQAKHTSHLSHTPWALPQTAYIVGSTDFQYSTSRLSCLLSLQFGDGDTHYFERLIPGNYPSFLYSKGEWKAA